jgi:hypothetical protein
MLIIIFFNIVLSVCCGIHASLSNPLNQTKTAGFLQATIQKLELKAKGSQNKHATAIKNTKNRIKLAKDELLIERCSSISGISYLIASFLFPCSIPALQNTLGNEFVYEGCHMCASHPHQPYMSVASQGKVHIKNGHYHKSISGAVECLRVEELSSEPPLECDQLAYPQKITSSTHNGPILVRNGKHTSILKNTFLHNGSQQSSKYLFQFNNRYYKDCNVRWYHQCINSSFKQDQNSYCQHHRIIALAISSTTNGPNELFAWALPSGTLQAQHSIPDHLMLLTYEREAEKGPRTSTVGIDGFLWWMNANNGSLTRVDHRGVWETIPRDTESRAIWYDMSPDAHWLLERLETEGIRTTFRLTSCANAVLHAPQDLTKIESFQNASRLWEITTGIWLNIFFASINHSNAPLHMEPRWILRYHKLKDWLGKSNIIIIKGLQERIRAGTSPLPKNSSTKKGKKRKQF